MVEVFFLVEHEPYAYGQRIERFLHLQAQAIGAQEARGVFLCGDDEAWLGQVGEGLVDAHRIFLGELVVVAEGHGGDGSAAVLEVELHLSG